VIDGVVALASYSYEVANKEVQGAINLLLEKQFHTDLHARVGSTVSQMTPIRVPGAGLNNSKCLHI
jgi:hypothetical protein